MSRHILSTGQQLCYNENGKPIACGGSGQDAEFHPGTPWPFPRFISKEETVYDALTGLTWSQDANPGEFPCSWLEAFEAILALNRRSYGGHQDWRLPNRRELRSLMDYQTRKPALPSGHPFSNVFLHWYWSSTTAAIHPGYAWYVHLEGARMFYGKKSQEALFWPVRGKRNEILAATGQQLCYDETGITVDCQGSGQDGGLQCGAPWPEPRFTLAGDLVCDHLTGLIWMRQADLTEKRVSWQQALDAVRELNRSNQKKSWRLPTINELESLVDADQHSPALPNNHPFTSLQEGYWSSTSSFFETDWAWVLYMKKGACGVGYKPGATFHAWPVTETVDNDR